MSVLRSAGLSVLSPTAGTGGSLPLPAPAPTTPASGPSAQRSIELTALDLDATASPASSSRPPQEVASPASALSTPTSGSNRVSRRRFGAGGARLTIDTVISEQLEQSEHALDNNEGTVFQAKHPAEDVCSPGMVASVWGRSSDADKFAPFFAARAINVDNHKRLAGMPYLVGVHCQRGQKPSQPNQDDFFVLERNEWVCFGVLDGHGSEGHVMSHFAQERLPKYVLDKFLPKAGQAENWEQSCTSAFAEVTEEMKQAHTETSALSGTTASVVLLRGPTKDAPEGPYCLHSAFVGDSSIVYGRRPKSGGDWEVVQLGDNHRPDREDEAMRIKGAGGEVMVSTDPKFPSRLLAGSSGLSMSRSIGDFAMAKCGLICEPEVPSEVQLEDGYEYIILCCSDGVWDMIEKSAAINIVAKFAPNDSQRAAERLARKAEQRWKEQEGGTMGVIDDITVLLVRLNPDVVSMASPKQETT
mmetsp:Transcript_63706/g.136959  ORF Transcript_63706/g.136959 Transcript_63706/m.136959 type:complete len:472 (+) Transcript_63706:116-1531(+)